METAEVIKSRRSTRKYQARPVEREKLSCILDAGRYAPSGGNNQTTHFLVIQKNMMLMANELDLGSCWINQLKWLNENQTILKYLRELGLEENERVYGAVSVGYADTKDGNPIRMPLERTGNPVTWI